MASLSEVLLLIRWSGLKHVFRILQNTRKREKLDRQYIQDRHVFLQNGLTTTGQLMNAEIDTHGGQFKFENASLHVSFLSQDLLRITWEPGIPPVPYAIAKDDWPALSIKSSESIGSWNLSSPLLQLNILPNGGLQFKKPDGVLLREELPPFYRGLTNISAWTSISNLEPAQCVYGLGEQSEPFNLRGTSHEIWNNDPGGSYSIGFDPVYMPLPVYFNLHPGGSYLLFYENSFRANISFGNDNSKETIPQMNDNSNEVIRAEFEGGQLRYYLILGPPEHALHRFAELTGYPAMPPIWSLGYHQSRWGYKDGTDIREVVAGFKSHDLPISAIHLDIDYLDGYRVFTINNERFPDMTSLAGELEKQGIRLVTIIDPGVKKDPEYFLYNEGIEGGYFCFQPDGRPAIGLVWPGWSAFPDFTDPRVRLWWSKQYSKMLDAGVAGIWHDMNEPSSFAAWGNPTLPMSTRHTMEGHGGDHLQAHNLYALLMNRSAFEGMRKLRPERRPWIVSRSGWVSSQRYAWKWTGDTESSWESLRMTISTILGTGLSGQPYSGPDIGGFRGDPPAELFLRYFQLSAFLPFFRTHSAVGSERREPWVFGEPYTSIIRQYLNLRYQLIPYLYTLAWMANQKGHPLVRPLFWADINDQDLWQIDDAFLLGDNLLVAPVLEEGAIERNVRFPKNNWMNMLDGQIYKGPGSATLPVSLEHIPVLVREGSLIPMIMDKELELRLYGSPNLHGSNNSLLIGQIYSDAGDGYGDWRLDSFHASNTKEGLTITWESEGDYPFPYQDIKISFYGLDPKTHHIDGTQYNLTESSIVCSKFHTLQIKI